MWKSSLAALEVPKSTGAGLTARGLQGQKGTRQRHIAEEGK